MKATNLTTVAKRTSIVILTVLFLVTTVGAQNVKAESQKVNKLAIENLIAGIKSDNDGLKRDCIYYAAIYGIEDAVDVLKEQLDKEKNPSNRVLIALALYKLGVKPEKGELAGYISIDWDTKVKKMAEMFGNGYHEGITSSDKK